MLGNECEKNMSGIIKHIGRIRNYEEALRGNVEKIEDEKNEKRNNESSIIKEYAMAAKPMTDEEQTQGNSSEHARKRERSG